MAFLSFFIDFGLGVCNRVDGFETINILLAAQDEKRWVYLQGPRVFLLHTFCIGACIKSLVVDRLEAEVTNPILKRPFQ